MADSTRRDVIIRGIDPTLHRELRKEAIDRGLTVGAMLNLILGERYGKEPNAPRLVR